MPTVMLILCHSWMSFNIDTGSQVDIIDEISFKKLKLKPKLEKCTTILFAYNSHKPIPLLGQFTTRVLHGGCYKSITFFVTQGSAGNLLSYKSAVLLNVIKKVQTVDTADNSAYWFKRFSSLFTDKVGKLVNYEVKLDIDLNVRPRQEKLRHVPFHLRDGVALELKKMLEQDLIEPVIGPTPWVS